MKCPHCGTVQKGKTEFCETCGLRLPKHGLWRRIRSGLKKARCAVTRCLGGLFRRIPVKARVIGGCCLVFAALAALLLWRLWPSATTPTETSARFLWEDSSGTTTVLLGDKALSTRLPGKVRDSQTSLRGDVAAALLTDGTLYYLSRSGVVLVAQSIEDFLLSVDGQSLLYRSGKEYLTLYRDGRRQEVGENVSARYVLSPDGKTVAFARSNDEKGILCVWRSGKTTRTSFRGTPVGISDGGDYLYHFTRESGVSRLYVNDRLLSDRAAVARFTVTRDGSCCAFVEERDGQLRLCVSESGAEARPLASVEDDRSVPQPVSREVGVISRTTDTVQVLYIGCDQFRSLFWRAGATLYFLTDRGELEEIARIDRTAGLYADQKQVWYVREGSDLLIHVLADARQEAEIVASGVTAFAATESGGVYWLDGEETLYYAAGSGSDARTVRRNIVSIAVIRDICVYENSDGFLYTCRRGGKSTLVKEDVSALVPRIGAVDYEFVRDGTRYVFSSADGKTFAAVCP